MTEKVFALKSFGFYRYYLRALSLSLTHSRSLYSYPRTLAPHLSLIVKYRLSFKATVIAATGACRNLLAQIFHASSAVPFTQSICTVLVVCVLNM